MCSSNIEHLPLNIRTMNIIIIFVPKFWKRYSNHMVQYSIARPIISYIWKGVS